MSFGCFHFDQKANKFFLRISALASKRGWIKKMKTLYLIFLIFKNYSIRDFFWFDLFLEARAEKMSMVFCRNEETKGRFEINWPSPWYIRFLPGSSWGRFTVHVAFPKWPINQFKLVHQSRKQVIRAYCPNIYSELSQCHENATNAACQKWGHLTKKTYTFS